jgi:inhibitor of cysteine peptidase
MKSFLAAIHAFAVIGVGFAAAVSMTAPSFAANDETLQVSVGASATLELDGNPSTGYSWVLDTGASANAELVTVADQGYAAAAAEPGKRPVLGAPKKQKFEVTGVAAGEAKLVFNYVKAGEDAPAKTAEYVVEVIGSDPE